MNSAAAALTHDQVGGNAFRATDRVPGIVEQFGHQKPARLHRILGDRGQSRAAVTAERHIIEPDDRDILRHAQVGVQQGTNSAERDLVRGADNTVELQAPPNETDDRGIGRLDLVENRYVGMKSRGVYETPGGTILHVAHRGIESITLDRGAMHLKEELMPRYAELVYFGYWFSPEREMLQSLIDKSQENVSGTVRLKLYKGTASVIGRKSPNSLYSMAHVTFEADSVYNQRDAEGFIKLNALRLRLRHQGK